MANIRYVWDAEIHWHWGKGNRPRWWEIYMLHPKIELGLVFDLLCFGLGFKFDWRVHHFEINVGPLHLWWAKP